MSAPKDPLFRYLALLQLIPRWPGRISTPALQEKLRDKGFEVDVRDLRDKLARHFSILPYTDEHPYRWGYRENAWFDPRRLPAQDTSAALALHLAASHLPHLLPQSVLDQLTPQLHAARDYLDGMEHNGLAHRARRVRSLPNGKALQPAELSPQIWVLVSTALVENRQLRVEYRSRSQGTSKSYRIKSAELLDKPACEQPDFEIDHYIDSRVFAWRQDAEEVELIADASATRLATRRNPSQPRTAPRTTGRQRLVTPACLGPAGSGNPEVDLRPQ